MSATRTVMFALGLNPPTPPFSYLEVLEPNRLAKVFLHVACATSVPRVTLENREIQPPNNVYVYVN